MINNFLSNKKLIFDSWASSYDWLFPSVFYQAIHKRLLEYVDLPNPANILDLGCGTGRLLQRLATEFHQFRGTGLDLSSNMVRQARLSNRHHPRLIFLEGKAESLPFGNGQFDAVFNTISFLHYKEPEQVLKEVSRVLAPGGRFYLVDFTVNRGKESPVFSIAADSIKFYSPYQREVMGSSAGLLCMNHYYLLGPVLLTVFAKPT